MKFMCLESELDTGKMLLHLESGCMIESMCATTADRVLLTLLDLR